MTEEHRPQTGPPRQWTVAGRDYVARPRGVATLLAIVVVSAALALAGESVGHAQSSPAGTISVTGSGTVRGTPDTMSFQIGVQTVAPSAQAAIKANNGRMGAVESTLTGQGLATKDLQTSGLSIYQNTNSSGVITGFTVSHTLSVTTHQLRRAGALIDAAASAAGNGIQFYGVTFSISNDSKLIAAARARAMDDAHSAAVQIARGGHTHVGSIIRITDQENANPVPIFFGANALASARSTAVPIQAGSQSVNVQVLVVYALNS